MRLSTGDLEFMEIRRTSYVFFGFMLSFDDRAVGNTDQAGYVVIFDCSYE